MVLVGAEGGMGLSGVVLNLTFFFGFWFGVDESGLSGLEVCLVRFFVVGVLIRRRVVFERGKGVGCATYGCVSLLLLSSITIWVMMGSGSPVRVYRS